MPQGFRKDGKVLKLKKTLYGLKQSPRMFWKYLTKAMQDSGMQVSKLDPSLQTKNPNIFSVYSKRLECAGNMSPSV